MNAPQSSNPQAGGVTTAPSITLAVPIQSTLAPTSAATLPPTLTPIVAAATPTPLVVPLSTVEVSKADAKVIEQAKTNIPLYRQGDVVITVQDSKGNPLSGYVVKYQQVAHQFQFMTFDDPPSKIRYLRPIGFNSMTLNLWWTLVEPEEGKFNLDVVNTYRNIEELHSGGFTLKAQGVLFFTGESTDTPPYLYQASFEDLLQLVKQHMTTLVRRFAPYIDRWEAINEPDLIYRNPFKLTKAQYLRLIQASANAIRANDPGALIEINFSEPCQPRVEQMLKDILDAGIDFDVVGLQLYYNAYVDPKYHYQPPRLTLAEISACLDRYEELLSPYGKRIAGEVAAPSEAPSSQRGYWGETWDEDLQAQYLTAAYTIFFSKPTNMATNYWNGVDPSSFVWKSGLVDETGNPKKAYWALQDLIRSWTTQGEGVTDPNGQLQIHGFGGKYDAVITDPATRAWMKTVFEIQEQQSQTVTLTFVPDADLLAMRDKLQRLVDYWQTQSSAVLVQKGKDYLALVDYHLASGERDRAEQTLKAGLEDLAVNMELHISGSQLKGSNGFIVEHGDGLLWSGATAYYQYTFPMGVVHINVNAKGSLIDNKWPTMVIGIGDKYSEPLVVTSGYQTYSTTFLTTGSEQILTIRFLYENSTNPGEWKLYVDRIDVSIRTDDVESR